MATLALAVALSDQPWVKNLIDRLRANAAIVQDEVRMRRTSEQAAESQPVDELGEARRAAAMGEIEDLREHLARAAEQLRERTGGLSETLRQRHEQLATEIEQIAEEAETGAEGVRAINSLVERAQGLTAAPEGNSD